MRLKLFSKAISKDQLLKEWTESRALPMGRGEFETWANRIIDASNIPADRDSQKAALGDMILHLGPTEDHKEDAHFIKHLRKVSVNQVAHAMFTEYRDKIKARLAAQEAVQKASEVPSGSEGAEKDPA